MKIKKWTIGVLLMAGLLIGGIGAGTFLTGQPGRAEAQTTDPCAEDDDSAEAPDTEDMDDVEEEVQCGPEDENEADEADEMAPTGLTLTAVQAQQIAEEANPGVATLAVEFDRENGHDIWEVELDNGQDVKVDANSGEILLTETRDE